MAKERCFVVMGFGTKTDLATGRRIDLNKSYLALIKPVVESRGMTCVRADEIPHSGTIDVPMYEELLTADIVIADLSTANTNAFYELGIRYALKPRTTIVISEDKFCLPFDVNHITVKKYVHLGDNIDYFEVMRFQKVLGETIDYVLQRDKPDSPVYTFLNGLIPPALKKEAEELTNRINESIAQNSPNQQEGDDKQEENQTLSIIIKKGEKAIKSEAFSDAKDLFKSAILLGNCSDNNALTSTSAYLHQRLALATYKAALPNEKSALLEANAILEKLDLLHTNDSETVVLAAAIEKKLYEIGDGIDHLTDAIILFQRAYFLLHNRYNGINLAYLLDCRADSELDNTEQEKIADMVWANRIRKDILLMCQRDHEKLSKSSLNENLADLDIDQKFVNKQEKLELKQKFYVFVNQAEASFGLGDFQQYNSALEKAKNIMAENPAFKLPHDQLDRIREIHIKYGKLLNPEWKEEVVQ